MVKKLILFSFSFIISFHLCHAQSFLHGVGGTVSVLVDKVTGGGNNYTNMVSFTNLTYFPRFTLNESEISSISVGIPLGAGVGFDRNEGTLYYGFDIPLVIDFNKGRKSTRENEDKFGWYVGTGFGYMATNWSDGNGADRLNSFGPMLRAGIRFGAGPNRPDRATTVGFYFKSGLEESKIKSFGIAALYEL